VPFKVLKSIRKARRTIRDFGADAVVGFGGYASAPVLWAAQRMGVPTVIQEQNSYAGVTNKILAKGARRICTAYEGMERFFPAAKIVLTGNPLRGRFSKEGADRAEALEYYGLTPDLPVILVVGGSLGTRSLNEMMKAWIVGTDGKAPEQVIEVIVYPDSRLSIRQGKDMKPVDIPGLVAAVKTAQGEKSNIPVVIAADKDVRYEDVVNVLKLLQSADVPRVGLALRIERSAEAR